MKEVPNSWKANQYDNPSNAAAHYDLTGPEIWEQTGGTITHLVCGVGTGGTISGVGKLPQGEESEDQGVGIDTYGSVLKKYKETGVLDKNEIYPYITEGIGEDFLPKNVDFSVIDYFEKVTDKDAALMTRRIAREEGIFAGNSAGSAMAGLLQLKDNFRAGDVIVVIFHDHGSRYLGKMFNDDWMREKGFFEKSGMTARDLVASGMSGELLAIEGNQRGRRGRAADGEHDFSQISITHDGRLVGSLNETHLYNELVQRPRHQERAGRVDHAARVSVRRHLHAGVAAGDDDHAGDAGGAGARLQDRQDVHHHAVGYPPGLSDVGIGDRGSDRGSGIGDQGRSL